MTGIRNMNKHLPRTALIEAQDKGGEGKANESQWSRIGNLEKLRIVHLRDLRLMRLWDYSSRPRNGRAVMALNMAFIVIVLCGELVVVNRSRHVGDVYTRVNELAFLKFKMFPHDSSRNDARNDPQT